MDDLQNGKVADKVAQPASQAAEAAAPEYVWGPPCNSSCCYLILKRLGDFIVALFLIGFLAPILFLVAVAICVDSGRPILYRQIRIGKRGKPFRFFKYRSMVIEAEKVKADLLDQNEASGPIFKMKNDPRVTRVGRYLRRSSIDELPQLFNVLRGEISLVGPRPHLPKEVEQYRPDQMERLSVQPGLVCLREISGRSRLSFEQWVALDLEYIHRRSLRLDMYIFIKAIGAVVSGDGAY